MKISSYLKTLLVIITCLNINTSWSFAQDVTDVDNQMIENDPEAILDKFCDFIKQQKNFTVNLNITYDNVLDSGAKVQYSALQIVRVQKPGRLQVDYDGDQRNTRFYYNGESFTLYSVPDNLYATSIALPTIEGTLRQIEETYDLTIPLSNLYVEDPCALVTPNIEDKLYIDLSQINETNTHHLLFMENDRHWQIWLTEGDKPVPLKIVITYKDLPQSPQYTAVFSDWNFNPNLPPDTFNFQPPKDSYPIEMLRIK
jgi:hypothetical protein